MLTKLTAISLALLSLLAALGLWAHGLRNLHTTLLAQTWPQVQADQMAFSIEERPIMRRTRHITHFALWVQYAFLTNGQRITGDSEHLLRVFSHRTEAEALQRRLAQGLTIRFNPDDPHQHLPQVEMLTRTQGHLEFFAIGLVFFLGSLLLFSAQSGHTSKAIFAKRLETLRLKSIHTVGLFFILGLSALALHHWEMFFFAASYLGLTLLSTRRCRPFYTLALVCLGLYTALGIQSIF